MNKLSSRFMHAGILVLTVVLAGCGGSSSGGGGGGGGGKGTGGEGGTTPSASFEPNDTIATAYDLRSNEDAWLSSLAVGFAAQSDDDYWRISTGVTRTKIYIKAIFNHNDGDIDIQLVDALGTVLDSSLGITNSEEITFDTGSASTDFFIRVHGANAGNVYDLFWSALETGYPINAEDQYEENDDGDTAYPIKYAEQIWLSDVEGPGFITSSDEDWYELEITPGYTRMLIECKFVHLSGDLDIELYKRTAAGAYELMNDGFNDAGSYSIDDDELLDFDTSGAGINSGSVYLKVFGIGVASNSYNLTWDDLPPGGDDAYEENDTLATAYDFSGSPGTWLSTIAGAPVQRDDDWYMISVPAGQTVVSVDCTFTNADGDIDIQLTDSAGLELDGSASFTDNESIVHDVALNGYATGGTFYIRVYYGNSGNQYDLQWSTAAPLLAPPADG